MRTNRYVFRLMALIACLALAGCAPKTGASFTGAQARTAHSVSMGVIIQLDEAFINEDATGLGTMGGAVVGGVAGSTIGGGRGTVLATLGGAIIGGLVGTGIERAVTSRDAIDITVRLETGQVISIVQELGPEERFFRVGDTVRVLRGQDGSARVRR